MEADLSFVHLIAQASVVVQGVMIALALASLMSWTMIFERWRTLKKARAAAEAFENRFWSGGDLGQMYKEISAEEYLEAGLETIFEAGFREFTRLRKQPGVDAMAMVAGCQRAMRVALSRAIEHLENHLPFLATVGSTSPYVGLFGTVWGIMNSFHALGNVKQATIAMVAPGIAEALIATAMGLVAAIPAVIAYNRYAYEVERLTNRYDSFQEEFATILQRQAHLQQG